MLLLRLRLRQLDFLGLVLSYRLLEPWPHLQVTLLFHSDCVADFRVKKEAPLVLDLIASV